VYALEGSIAVTGRPVQWLRDQLDHLRRGAVGDAGRSRGNTAGCIRTGVLRPVRPYWRSTGRDRRLSRFNTNAHLAGRPWIISYQSRDVVEAMAADSGVTLDTLKWTAG